MKNRKFLLAPIALLMALMSCKRDVPFQENDKPSTNGQTAQVDIKDLVVPANFDFKTEKELSVRVKVAGAAANERYVIKIYNNVPATGALIATGITGANAEYTTKINVPAFTDYIYIEKIDAAGNSAYEKVKANQFISALLQNNGEQAPYVIRKSGSGMDCNSGCTYTKNNPSHNITVDYGKTVCVTGTISNNIDIRVKSGGIVKICGSGSFDELKIEGSGKAYILENAVIDAKKIKVYSSSAKLYNWSDSVKVSDDFLVKGYAENHGKIYSTDLIEIDQDGITKNYGTIKVIGNADNDIKVKGKLYNYHYTIVGNDLKIEDCGKVYNYCLLQVNDDLENEGYLWSNCYIKVGDNFDQKDGGDTDLDNGAFLSADDFYLEDYIEGTGTNRSKIKVADYSYIKSHAKVKGKIDLCDSTGIENNSGTIQSPAAASCSGYLASSTCQPEAFGAPQIQDADNDGVPDAQDEYPNDADRAFNSYYPSANSTATLAFEDLWPATGDYDYNDLTLAFNIHKVLNADNKVVDYKVKMKVRSVGASFDNGFGWQFDDLVPSDVKSVNGQTLVRNLITRNANGTEANQSKAVIIAYDSPEPSMHRATGSMFNTIAANPTGTADTMYIDIEFDSPVADSKLGIEKFNPFIFTNRRRDYEVHLGNFAPTSLASTGLFGTMQDASNPSQDVYYKTANGLPWAILISDDFVYPVERTPITEAYNYFDDWALSSGTNYTSWYSDETGNRNILKLFGLQ